MQPFTPAAKKLFAHSGHRTNTTYGLCLPSCMHCATTTTTFFAYCWPIFMKTPSLGTICAFGRILHLVLVFGDVAGAVICSVVCKSFLAMIIIFIEIVLCLYSLSVFPDNFDYYLYSILSLCRTKNTCVNQDCINCLASDRHQIPDSSDFILDFYLKNVDFESSDGI